MKNTTKSILIVISAILLSEGYIPHLTTSMKLTNANGKIVWKETVDTRGKRAIPFESYANPALLKQSLESLAAVTANTFVSKLP